MKIRESRECQQCGRILPKRAYRAICATCRKPEHLRKGPSLPVSEQCGILDERSEVLGDNGGCVRRKDYHCERCGLPVCRWHTWSEKGQFICSVCFGTDGVERDPSKVKAVTA